MMAINPRRSGLALCGALALMVGCATGTAVTDQSIEHQVLTRIAQEPRLNSAMLTVREDGGAVSIGGFIDTLNQQAVLERIVVAVSGVDGVTSVRNRTTNRMSTEDYLPERPCSERADREPESLSCAR